MKKFLSMALALAMTLSLVVVGASAKDFTDKSKITYGEAVDVVSAVKIIDGYTDGSFNPSATLTRGAAAKIICNMVLGPTTAAALGVSSNPFKDVSVSNVFAGYIAYCASKGIINGYADKTFRPSGTVTGYQFLKMLLGALGYDATIEGYVGANWEVNVAKQAKNLGLYSGNSKFTGTAAMTREEACQYAFNTMKSTLVEYADKGTNITINGVTISKGASKPSYVTSTVAKEQNISSKKLTTGQYTVEFGERYFTGLKLVYDADAFERPAHSWINGTATIGQYVDTADKTYTAETKVGTIYTDLGLSKTIEAKNITLYVDGLKTDIATDIVRGGEAIIGGNGVKTDVYYSTDLVDGKEVQYLTICEMNTYVGDVAAKTAKSAAKDAYVTIASRGNAPVATSTFTTEDFAVNDVVLFNYSKKTGENCIESAVKAPAKITGKLTEVTLGKKATVADKSYDYSAKIANAASSDMLKFDVDAILDTYGYLIDVQATNTNTAYAYVLNVKSTAGDFNTSSKAELLFTDATTKVVDLTNSADPSIADAVLSSDKSTTGYANDVHACDLVKYSINNAGKYTLTRAAAVNDAANLLTNGSLTAAKPVKITNGSYAANLFNGTAGATNTYSASTTTVNGKTLFVVISKSGTDTVYNVYEGIKAVPSIESKATTAMNVTAYMDNGVAKIVVVDARANASISTNSAVYLMGKDNVALTQNTTEGNYYTFTAIVNGEVKENFKVSESSFADLTAAKLGGLFSNISKDAKYDIYTVSGNTNIAQTVGTGKYANKTITIGGHAYGYTSDCVVYYQSTNNVLTKIDPTNFVDDANDIVYFKTNDGQEVTTVIVKEVKDTNAKALTAGGNIQFYSDKACTTSIASAEVGSTVYVKSTVGSTTLTSSKVTLAKVTDATSSTGAVYSFTMPSVALAAADFTEATAIVINSMTYAGGNFTVNAIAPATVTTSNTYTVKIASTAGAVVTTTGATNFGAGLSAGAAMTLTAPYAAVSGTGDYIVTVTVTVGTTNYVGTANVHVA